MSKKNMTPAQVAEKIAKFVAKNEATLKRYPVGPMANSARLNLNKAQVALASLQEANEGMRVGKQNTQQLQGNPISNDMNYMQAKYGGYVVPKYDEGGPIALSEGEPYNDTLMTPQLLDMTKTLMERYGWTEKNALMGASVAYKETLGKTTRENSYYNTPLKRIRKIFEDNKNVQSMSDEKILSLLDQADANQSDAFFNHAYANMLGNGDVASGDGSKYRGVGLVQFTGKDNVLAASKSLGLGTSLVDDPSLLNDPEIAGQLGAWWVGDKASKGVKDFDVTQDISEEDTPDFLNGIYATVSSGGTVNSKAQRDKLPFDKSGDPKLVYTEGMDTMKVFLNSVLPEQGNLSDSTDVAINNLESIPTPIIQQPPSVEETLTDREIQAAQQNTGYDDIPTDADISAENNIAVADVDIAKHDWTDGTARVITYKRDEPELRKSDHGGHLDLDFEGSKQVGGPLSELTYTDDKDFVYTINEFGDYNVFDPATKEYSIVREENIPVESMGDSNAWKQAVAQDGIPYDHQIDGSSTQQDIDRMFQTTQYGSSETVDGPAHRTRWKNAYEERQGAKWGAEDENNIEISIEDAIQGNLKKGGFKDVTFDDYYNAGIRKPSSEAYRKKLKGDKLKKLQELDAQKLSYDEAYAKEQTTAYSNPGSYKFSLPKDRPFEWMGGFQHYMETGADALLTSSANSPIGQWTGLDDKWANSPYKTGYTDYEGVAGYSKHGDYVSQNLLERAETDEERLEALNVTNHYQKEKVTTNLIGDLIDPKAWIATGTLVPKAATVAKTASTGVRVLNKIDDVAVPFTRGTASLTGRAAPKVLNAADNVVPYADDAARATGLVDDVARATGNLGDDAVKVAGSGTPANTYVPNLRGKYRFKTDGSGQLNGMDMYDAFRAGKPLRESSLGVADDFAETMGKGVDDFFGAGQGARVGGGNRTMPTTYPGAGGARNLPAVGGPRLPAVGGSNLPLSMRGNLPGLIPKGTPATIKIPGLGMPRGLGLNGLGLGANGLRLGVLGAKAAEANRFIAEGRKHEQDNKTDIPVNDGVVDPDKDKGDVTDLLNDQENTSGYIPKQGDWSAGEGDIYNLPENKLSAMMAVPALASLASAKMQSNALKLMSGPQQPISTMMHDFNYKSNIGQQLQEVKDASNAVMKNTNLQGQQQAALNQQVAAQRLRSNSGLLQQDAQQEQAARARYDAMATQVRMSNDKMRNQYLQDSTNFKNKKQMLLTQAKQQPLNVLSSSASDYLQNIYQANLAAQLEAVGRPYRTGYEDEEE